MWVAIKEAMRATGQTKTAAMIFEESSWKYR
jgi:hypothetical protein